MAKPVPQLPPEIWMRVLECHRSDETLPELWNTLRHVSTMFKKAIETIFSEKLLPKTWVTFNIGDRNFKWDDADIRLIEFDFSYLSDDKSLAVFKADRDDIEEPSLARLALQTIAEDISFDEPPHTINVRRELTDGPLPGLSFNSETWEISCDWRELYTAFYGEIELIHKLDSEWLKEQTSSLDGIQSRMEQGQLNLESMLMQTMNSFATSHEKHLKIARRTRIRRQFKERKGIEWDMTKDGDLSSEKVILGQLAKERQLLGFLEFSDDENEEDEEDQDDDGDSEEIVVSDEEKEWEDEDEDSGEETHKGHTA